MSSARPPIINDLAEISTYVDYLEDRIVELEAGGSGGDTEPGNGGDTEPGNGGGDTQPPPTGEGEDVVVAATATLNDKVGINIKGPAGGIISLTLNRCRDVTIVGQTFKPNAAKLVGLQLNDCSNIRATNNTWVGDWSRTNDAYGIRAMNSTGITVEDNDFSALGRCAIFDHCSHISVLGNDVHDNRSEGFNFVGTEDVEIAGNSFSSWNATSSDHPDCIQFWTTGAKRANKRAKIHHNVARLGNKKVGSQGIYMDADETVSSGGVSLQYEDFVIEDNCFENSYPRQAQLYYCRNGTIRRNTCLQGLASLSAGGNKAQINMYQMSGNVVYTGNLANSIAKDGVIDNNAGTRITTISESAYAAHINTATFVPSGANGCKDGFSVADNWNAQRREG